VTFHASAWQIALAALLPVFFCLLAVGLFTVAFSFCLIVVAFFDAPFEVVLRHEPAQTLKLAIGKL